MSFQNHRYLKLLMISCLMIAVTLALSSCGGGGGKNKNSYGTYSGPTTSGTLVVDSVSQDGTRNSYSDSSFFSMNSEPITSNGFICSGPPTSLTVVLKQIRLHTDQGDAVVWTGPQTLVLDGEKPVIEGLNLVGVPKGVPITEVIMTFNINASITGTLTKVTFNSIDPTEPKDFYTKSEKSYNAVTHQGGADSYTFFTTGPAEPNPVTLDGDGNNNETQVSTPCNYTYNEGDPIPTISILFDLSRMLRFYNGMSSGESGVNPLDPPDKAYFFCHSVFRHSVAGFIGNIGKVQGYETNYTSPGNVKGWMTLILDEEGHFLAGNLIGDDDNDLTIAKGWITGFTPNEDGTYKVTYEIGAPNGGNHVFTIWDLDLNDPSKESNWTSTNPEVKSGNATFTLKLKVP